MTTETQTQATTTSAGATTTTAAPAATAATEATTSTAATQAQPNGTPATTAQEQTLLTSQQQTQDPKGQGNQSGAQGPAAEIELQLPEGFQADEARIGEFKGVAKDLGLKSDGAQKLFNLHVSMLEGARAQADQAWKTMNQQWVESAKADKEYGGADFEKNLAIAQKAFARFGTPELTAFLNEMGVGNHPELIRWAYRAGRAIAEDSLAGTSGPGTTTTEKQLLKELYPNSPELYGETSG